MCVWMREGSVPKHRTMPAHVRFVIGVPLYLQKREPKIKTRIAGRV